MPSPPWKTNLPSFTRQPLGILSNRTLLSFFFCQFCYSPSLNEYSSTYYSNSRTPPYFTQTTISFHTTIFSLDTQQFFSPTKHPAYSRHPTNVQWRKWLVQISNSHSVFPKSASTLLPYFAHDLLSATYLCWSPGMSAGVVTKISTIFSASLLNSAFPKQVQVL